mmetsp:Transcript_36920/g.94434  ORF Transcript_36920/g.94434 Transcript_36920/m.94434 type:complete len:494 (-) Transcript_36920:47-1528(-)
MSMTDGDYGLQRANSDGGSDGGGSGSLSTASALGTRRGSYDTLSREHSMGQEELNLLLMNEERPQHSDFHNNVIRACWFEGGVFPEDLMAMLAMLGEDFFFDVVGLYELMGQRPLATVTLYLLHKFELVGRLELDEDRLEAFLLTIEDGYPMESNPFTNKLHAADVVARFAAMVGSHRGALIFGSDAALLGGILAAAIHDFAHTGRSNSYHVALGDFVARQFNDQSVLENLSLQKALDLMATPRFDFAYKSRLSRDARRKMRTLIIEMVLATDMGSHAEVLAKFESQIVKSGYKAGKDAASLKAEITVAQLILKAADLGFYALPLRQHLYWCKALQNEMFLQGDAEKHQRLPISPLMDRSKSGVMHPKNQLGFLEVIVVPMFTLLHHVLPGPDGVLRGLTQLRATADFYRRPNSVTVTAQSLETFREELVAISTERYESIVGSTLDGNLLGATSSKGITVSARGLVEDHSSREKPISEISPASFDLPPGVDME